MSRWMYAGLYFREPETVFQELERDSLSVRPRGKYKELLVFAGKLVRAVSPQLVDRYYFFFEPQPHFFLALELQDRATLQQVATRLKRIPYPAFAERLVFGKVGRITDPQAARDFFHAGTKFALSRAAGTFRSTYKDNDIAKLVHCFCNQQLVTRANELDFYARRLHAHRRAKK